RRRAAHVWKPLRLHRFDAADAVGLGRDPRDVSRGPRMDARADALRAHLCLSFHGRHVRADPVRGRVLVRRARRPRTHRGYGPRADRAHRDRALSVSEAAHTSYDPAHFARLFALEAKSFW